MLARHQDFKVYLRSCNWKLDAGSISNYSQSAHPTSPFKSFAIRAGQKAPSPAHLKSSQNSAPALLDTSNASASPRQKLTERSISTPKQLTEPASSTAGHLKRSLTGTSKQLTESTSGTPKHFNWLTISNPAHRTQSAHLGRSTNSNQLHVYSSSQDTIPFFITTRLSCEVK